MTVSAKEGTILKVWPGDPSYDKEVYEVRSNNTSFHLFEKFGRIQGKYVIQLFDGDELLDEYIYFIQPGTPLLVSSVQPGILNSKLVNAASRMASTWINGPAR